MKDDEQIPNKSQVNVELPSAFGGRRFQQVDIEGSKVHPVDDFNWYVLNQLGVPARVPDVMTDMLLWIAASSFVGSVGKQLIRLPGVAAIAAMILAIAMVLSIYILKIATVPQIRWSLVYRWFLIFIGISLGVR